MTIELLPRVGEPDPGRDGPGNDEHPMRRVTVQTAFEPTSWTSERARKVAHLFDELAADWSERGTPERFVPLCDALARGGPFPTGHCLELGSGVGLVTGIIAEAIGDVVAFDLSHEMLHLAPPGSAPRVLGDANRLPVPDASVATVVCQNMLLFPLEVDRVLRRDGVLVWVNSVGPFTPIHLSADEVHRALPGDWSVVASEAGEGTWAVARRA